MATIVDVRGERFPAHLANATQPTALGAAASFVALLLWLYYTSRIFLFGAEFTACLAGVRGAKDKVDKPIGSGRSESSGSSETSEY